MLEARRRVSAVSPGLDLLALILVLLLGLALRLYDLTNYGIWFDEAYHVALVRLPTTGSMLDAALSNPPSDPLYALILRGWVGLFGHGDAAIRSLSVLLGSATIVAAWWLGSTLGSRRAGLLGAGLFAVSPYAIEFGQEAALYGLATLATTLALAAGVCFLRTGRGALIYALLGTVTVYSHYVAVVILGLFALLSLVLMKRVAARARWLELNGLIALTWSPWLVAMLVHWARDGLPRAAITHRTGPGELLGALVQYTSGTASLQLHAGLLQALGLAAGGLLLLAALVIPAEAGRFFRVLAIVTSFIFFVPAVISYFTGWWLFVSHFMLFLLPALLLGLAWAVIRSGFARRPALRAVLLACLCAWLVVQVWGLALYYLHPPHGADGLRELAAVLRAKPAGEPVFVTPPLLAPSLSQYYNGPVYGLPSDFDVSQVYLPYDPTAWNSACLGRLDSLAVGHPRFWLLYRPELDQGGAFLETLRRTYTLVEHRSYAFADLYRFAR